MHALHFLLHLAEYVLRGSGERQQHGSYARKRAYAAPEKPHEESQRREPADNDADTTHPAVPQDGPQHLAPDRQLHARVVEPEGKRRDDAPLDLWRLADAPLQLPVDLQRPGPVAGEDGAARLVHPRLREVERREGIDRRRRAGPAPRKAHVVRQLARRHLRHERRRLRHLVRRLAHAGHDHLRSAARVDRYLVGAHQPPGAVGGPVLELERREPQHALSQRADAVGEAPRVAVGVGLRARVVEPPVAAVHGAGKARRVQRTEVGLAKEVDREHHRVSDLDVVGVKERTGPQARAGHPGKLYRAEKRGENVHRHPVPYYTISRARRVGGPPEPAKTNRGQPAKSMVQ